MGSKEIKINQSATSIYRMLEQQYQKEGSALNLIRAELSTLESQYEDIRKKIELAERELTFIEQRIETTDIEDPALIQYNKSEKKIKKRLITLNNERFECTGEIQRCVYDLNELEPAVHQIKELILLAEENNQCILSKSNVENLQYFPHLIKDNIESKWNEKDLVYNSKLMYKGRYIKEITKDKSKKKFDLNETVEEVVYQYRMVYDGNSAECLKKTDKYLITREIGTSDITKFPVPDTRISLVYEEDDELRVWVPTLEEMILAFAKLYRMYGSHHLGILRRLNYEPDNFDITNLRLQQVDYVMDEEIKRVWFNNRIPIKVYYALLKHILISEDKRYSGLVHFGRDMIILAIYDYVYNKVSMDELKSKYNITNFK